METKQKILFIEDDVVVSDMYTVKLKKEGFEVKQAFNGLEWLTALEDFHPDIILLDIMMPSMNGFETLQAIKKQTSNNSKIIMFTNIVDKEKLEEAILNGADKYIIKSDTNPSKLVETINEELKKSGNKCTPIYITPGLNIFKMKNPYIKGWKDIEVSVNIKL